MHTYLARNLEIAQNITIPRRQKSWRNVVVVCSDAYVFLKGGDQALPDFLYFSSVENVHNFVKNLRIGPPSAS